jgi:hypothetical protein
MNERHEEEEHLACRAVHSPPQPTAQPLLGIHGMKRYEGESCDKKKKNQITQKKSTEINDLSKNELTIDASNAKKSKILTMI